MAILPRKSDPIVGSSSAPQVSDYTKKFMRNVGGGLARLTVGAQIPEVKQVWSPYSVRVGAGGGYGGEVGRRSLLSKRGDFGWK